MRPRLNWLAQVWRAATFVALALASPSLATPSNGAERTVYFSSGNALVIPNAFKNRYAVEKDMMVRFDGLISVVGQFRLWCIDTCGAGNIELHFRPDDQQGKWPYWHQYRSKNVEIYITNPERFIRRLPERNVASLYQGQLKELSGRATISLKNLTVTVECDAPTYFADFVEAGVVAFANLDSNFGDC